MMFKWFLKKKKKISQSLVRKESSLKDSQIKSRLKGLFKNESIHFDDFLTKLEELLLTSDVSLPTTLYLVQQMQNNIKKTDDLSSAKVLFEQFMKEMILEIPFPFDSSVLNIVLVFGINGVGKTTSVAKMVSYFKEQGISLMVAAADTYRMAAAEQLKKWMDSLDVPLIYHQGKSKPSAVVFDALDSAISKKQQLLMIDTAGRMHTREDLLSELTKLKSIIQKKAPEANVIHLLVLDSTTGQNALTQAKDFHAAIGIDGVFLAKTDSSGKGGIAMSLSYELKIPVFFIGTGEKAQNMRAFSQKEYIQSILS